MSDAELRVLSKPNEAQLAEAIATAKRDCSKTPQELIKAMLVIVGEACDQMGREGKTLDETVASLVARGLPLDAARTFVNKAVEIVESPIDEAALRQAALRSYYRELIMLGLFAAAVVAYILLR